MVPFRAIAEALGAEVTYDAGAITAKKDGETLSFALGGKQLTVTDSAGKTVKTVQLDTAPYKRRTHLCSGALFSRKRSDLTVQWDQDMQTAVLYDRAALVNDIDSKFTVLNKVDQGTAIHRKRQDAAHGGDNRRGVHRLRHHRR